jgi:hypothetical protein
MMADPTPPLHTFTHRQLAEILIKQLDIHEGIWGIYVEFGLAAINAGPSDDQMMPTGMVAIKSIGLQLFPRESGISVDAAKVNPLRQKRQAARR